MSADAAPGGRFDSARLTVEGYRAAVTAFPPGPYRDFCLWVLDEPDLRRRWLQVIGLDPVVRMTDQVVAATAPGIGTDALAPYVAAMNVYQVFEIVSDNLAIGLAAPSLDDGAATRRRVLHWFNSELAAMLRGPRVPGQPRPRWYGGARQISGAAQSLAAAEHRSLAAAYRRRFPDVDADELDRSIGASLLSNRDTAAGLVRMVEHHATAPYVRESLARRYAAVNRLLDERPTDPAQLVAIGADTILVEPTLAYYCGVLAERLLAPRDVGEVLGEGLRRLLAEAAVAVRLLNDIGTVLLDQDSGDRASLLAALPPAGSLRESLLAAPDDRVAAATTRLRKDACFGEFNVGLDGLRDEPLTAATRRAFRDRVDYLADRYARARLALAAEADRLAARSRSGVLGDVVLRFVEFHRVLYARSFESDAGEYAVPATRTSAEPT